MTPTAEVHPEATLTPSKIDLVRAWLPTQQWFEGADANSTDIVGRFRFVDPDGEVGMETLLVTNDGVIYQVPLTYRDAPLEDADEYFVGNMEHSLLGRRWVYDAVGDPVYIDEIIRVIRDGDREADLSTGDKPSVSVRGSGVELIANSSGQARLHRVVDPAPEHKGFGAPNGTLDGTWSVDGAEKKATLVSLY